MSRIFADYLIRARDTFSTKFILKPVDPRIHFALVCGSRSCAPIDFYDIDTLSEQLDAASKSFVNYSEVIILPEERKVFLSEIFRWHEEDFGKKNGILDFIFDYLTDDEIRRFMQLNAPTLQIEYLHYDWNLNR